MSEVKDSYDAVVIGAGIGGLICGNYLVRNRMSVLIVEQGSKPGGYCTSFEHKGYIFNNGLSFLTGCELGGAIYETLGELELREGIEFVKMSSLIRIMGSDYDLHINPAEDMEDKLVEHFPMEAATIRKFKAECKALVAETERFFKSPPDSMNIWQKIVFGITFPFKYRKMRRYGGKSLREVIDRNFEDPKLKAILLSITPFDPGTMASLSMMIFGTKEDFYYPKGGAQALVELLVDGIKRYECDLALDMAVDKILIENNTATGVMLSSGKQVKARHVVSNVDAKQTFFKLVGEEHLPRKFTGELDERRLSDSVLMVSLGVSLNLRAMAGFDGTEIVYNPGDDISELFGTDPGRCQLGIKVPSIDEPFRAPDSTSAVQLWIKVPYDLTEDWEATGEIIADKLISSAEKVIANLSKHILSRHITTPLTLEQATSNSHGAVMGWYAGPRGKIRSQRTPVKKLYQAGQWTFPGGGVPQVMASGRNAAKLVQKDK